MLAVALAAWIGANAGLVAAARAAAFAGSPKSAVGGARPSPAPSGPQILFVSATPPIVHGGQNVLWDVRTTPDVVSVDAKVAVYALQLHKQSPGHFVLTFAVPQGLPWFFHGTYNLDVQAHSNSGQIAHRMVALVFQ